MPRGEQPAAGPRTVARRARRSAGRRAAAGAWTADLAARRVRRLSRRRRAEGADRGLDGARGAQARAARRAAGDGRAGRVEPVERRLRRRRLARLLPDAHVDLGLRASTPGSATNPRRSSSGSSTTRAREGEADRAAARPTFVKDSSKWGEWIADVERPAEQYRGRYQLRLDEARGLLGAGRSLRTRLPRRTRRSTPRPAPSSTRRRRRRRPSRSRRSILGTPYQWGGATPETNFDCSGLMQCLRRSGSTSRA